MAADSPIKPGTVLTALDPEPPEYTVVATSTGALWVHLSGPAFSGSESIDTWPEFITERGPVTVVTVGEIPENPA